MKAHNLSVHKNDEDHTTRDVVVVSQRNITPTRILYLLLTVCLFLSLAFPFYASSHFSEKEIDEFISDLGETDDQLKKHIRKYMRKLHSEDDVRELILKKSETEEIKKLAHKLGFKEIEKISVGTSHPGYSIFIKVFNKREWVDDIKYHQNVLYVANNEISNSRLLLEKSEIISFGNYFSNSDNIVTYTKCQIENKGMPINISVDERVTCQEIAEIIYLLERGSLTISSDLKNKSIAINCFKINYVSKYATVFEIHSRDTPTSNYIYKIEKSDNKLFLKAVYYWQS